MFIDPCEFNPCQDNGVCTSYKDRSGFTCSCYQRQEGTLCEKGKFDTFYTIFATKNHEGGYWYVLDFNSH